MDHGAVQNKDGKMDDGGQDMSTLSMRARIDSCFLATIQCQRLIEKIAALYRNGSRSLSSAEAF
jgi:hypothetical protein